MSALNKFEVNGTSVEIQGVDMSENQNTDSLVSAKSIKKYINDVVGDFFIYHNYYVSYEGYLYSTTNQNAATPFIPLQSVDSFTINGRSTTQFVPLYVFYDVNKKLVSAVGNDNMHRKTITVSKEDFPENAAYVRFNGVGDGEDTLNIVNRLTFIDYYETLKSIIPYQCYVSLEKPIKIDTYNRKIYIPKNIAIITKLQSRNPLQENDEIIDYLELDTSLFNYSYVLFYDSNNSTFVVNYLNNKTTHNYYVIGIINNTRHSVISINVDMFELDGTIQYNYSMNDKDIYDKLNNETNIIHGHGSLFTIPMKYVQLSTGRLINTENQNIITDYIDITNVHKITVCGRSTNLVALYAFYNANKNPIKMVGGTEYNNVKTTITREEFPENAKYIIVNGSNTDNDLCVLYDLQDFEIVYSNINKLSESIKDNINVNHISGVGTMGASLMYNGNNWVETACESLNINSYNKAISGTGIPSLYANMMWRDTYCTEDEFEDMDIIAFQFASSADIFTITDENITMTADDYTKDFDITSEENPFTTLTHAQCFDYIIKKWQERCYAQKDNENSKWYGTLHGKPCRMIFVTHWHDGRTLYNEMIRKLADRWGGLVCELDKNIGFNKNQTLPDGRQTSIIYAEETQEIDGVEFGWHPLRDTRGKYIQGRMAKIFADTIKKFDSFY